MMSSISRRNAIAVLGLAAAGSTEDAMEGLGSESTDGTKGYKFGRGTAFPINKEGEYRLLMIEQTASALEKLAAELRSGGSLFQESTLTTNSKVDDFLTHTLSVSFVLKDDVVS